jgi:hypothetical protein
MSFRRIMMGLLTLWLGLMGIVFGMLFVLCVSLFILWQGLSVGVVVCGLLCVSCFTLAGIVLRRGASKERPKLTDAEEPTHLSESDERFFDAPKRSRSRIGHRKQ